MIARHSYELHWFGIMLLMIALLPVISSGAVAGEPRWVGETLDGISCQNYSVSPPTGPWDYRNHQSLSEQLDLVERAHFTDRVRYLRGGQNSATPLGDLDYTIRAWPNHHQALYALVRFATADSYSQQWRQARNTTTRDGREYPPPECFLHRARAYAPEDHNVRILTGIFYHREGAYERARDAYQRAVELAPESAEAHYNFGLLLLDMERNEQAREHARKAYDLGYPLQGLKRRLAEAGHAIGD